MSFVVLLCYHSNHHKHVQAYSWDQLHVLVVATQHGFVSNWSTPPYHIVDNDATSDYHGNTITWLLGGGTFLINVVNFCLHCIQAVVMASGTQTALTSSGSLSN